MAPSHCPNSARLTLRPLSTGLFFSDVCTTQAVREHHPYKKRFVPQRHCHRKTCKLSVGLLFNEVFDQGVSK